MRSFARFAATIVIAAFCAAWSHGIGLTPPSEASAVGYIKLTFYDNFGSPATVDLNNTKASGYNWYVNNAWPHLNANGTAWTPFLTAPATLSSYLSFGTSGLEISDDNSHIDSSLDTCVDNGAGAFIGTTFANGLYLQVSASFDPSLATSGAVTWGSWPLPGWLVPAAFLDGTITNTNFGELDNFECFPQTATCNFLFTTHDWNTSNGTNNFFQINPSGSPTYTSPNTYGFLWVPASQNGGVGYIKRFLNDVQQGSTLTYSAGGSPSPALSPSNPTGALSEIDSQAFCLLLGTGHSWPMFVYSVQIWQL